MKEIPEQSEVVAAQTSLQSQACLSEVGRINDAIVDAIAAGATSRGAPVYQGKEPYVPADVARELQKRFTAKGWPLQFTRGTCGRCAIFLA